ANSRGERLRQPRIRGAGLPLPSAGKGRTRRQQRPRPHSRSDLPGLGGAHVRPDGVRSRIVAGRTRTDAASSRRTAAGGNMIPLWIVYALVFGTLLALAAWSLEHVFRLAALPGRWVWAGALGVTLLLVALAPQRAKSHARLRSVVPG